MMIVGVFMGDRPIPNCQIKILSVKTETRPEGESLRGALPRD